MGICVKHRDSNFDFGDYYTLPGSCIECDCEKLQALEAAGVDNWEGYDSAMEVLNS